MEDEKEIRFTQKKVDDSWKQAVESDRSKTPASEEPSLPISFAEFLTSLGVQALAHLGEIENPATGQKTKNLQAAKEIIDLLALLKDKTQGNLNPEEQALLTNLLAELQMRFVESSR